MNLVTRSLWFVIDLLIHIFTSPLLLIWRLSLYLLLPFAVYKPALSHYQKCRASIHTHPMVKSVAKRQVNIGCTILLLLVTFSLVLLEESLVYFVPWVTAHFQRTQYKYEHYRAWHSELALHLAGFVLSCVPFFSMLGAAVGMLFYTRQARLYQRFQHKMAVIGQPEATESSATDVGNEGVERSMVVEEQDLGGSSVSAPPSVVISTQRATVVRFKRNSYTPAGVLSIWGSRDGSLSGRYDGWSVQGSNFQDDIEMAEGVGRRK